MWALFILPASVHRQTDLRFLDRGEDLAAEELVAQLAVEALNEPVLAPEPLHPLVIDGLSSGPQQSLGAADAEARIGVPDLAKFLSDRPLLVWLGLVAQGGAGDVCQFTRLRLGQSMLIRHDHELTALLDGIGSRI